MQLLRISIRESLLLTVLIALSVTLYLSHCKIQELKVFRGRTAVLQGFLEDEDYKVEWDLNNDGYTIRRPGLNWDAKAGVVDLKDFTYKDIEELRRIAEGGHTKIEGPFSGQLK